MSHATAATPRVTAVTTMSRVMKAMRRYARSAFWREAWDSVLLKHHLERSIPGSSVTVLNRNNSADRLEAMTAVPADSPLTGSLPGARPRSCQAVRFANVHRETRGQDALMQCDVCGGCGPLTTCVPLLVGG